MTVTWPDGTVDCITFTYNRDRSIEQSTINGGESEYFNYFFLKKDVKAWNLGFLPWCKYVSLSIFHKKKHARGNTLIYTELFYPPLFVKMC